MRDELAHRGPDDAGLWLDAAAGIALGSRRLAISDLSSAGHQPMLSANGRFVLALNGEVYNATDLRMEIEAVVGPLAWRGHSDTEVLVEAIALWGLAGAVTRVNGMFALAVWDRAERRLSLARDRIGKKPLYYGWAGGTLLFGSELKALWRHPGFNTSVDPDSLAAFLRLGYVPGARSIFTATAKLRPGHVLHVGPDQAARRAPLNPIAWWSLKDAALAGLDARESDQAETGRELEALLKDAVARRMEADVPVGSFLSGGTDSSLITALMAAGADNQVRTFTIGFGVAGWDETAHARAVSGHLGTLHAEAFVWPDALRAVVDDLASIYDEPFADDSMIPTTLLSRLARRDVTVVLTGDGGDELFAGYERYADAARLLHHRRAAPAPARWLAGELARAAGPLARGLGLTRWARRARLLTELLGDGGAEAFNAAIMSRTLDPAGFMAVACAADNPLLADEYRLGRGTDVDRMLLMDTGSYLVDDILTKVDRASMAASLEVRCPLLDYRVIELSWRLRARDRYHSGRGKWPLREILYRHVPRGLVDRPKMGFSSPMGRWLSGPLRGWAESLLSRDALGASGLLNVRACRSLWEDFSARGREWSPMIWNVLMFQAWHQAMTAATATVCLPACPSGRPLVAA